MKLKDLLKGIVDDIVFLRKIIKGGADKSYGIQVAKLAGVPENVLNRAKELVVELSDADISQKAKDIAQYSKKVEKMNDRYKKVNELEVKQMTLFDTVKDDDTHTAAPEEIPTSTPSCRPISRPVEKASSLATGMISS